MNMQNKISDNKKYAYLCHLTIEELLELLAVAPIPAASPEKQAYVDALKEAIIEKENKNPTGFFPDIDEQWEQFVTYYLPEIHETAFEFAVVEHSIPAQTSQQTSEVPPRHATRVSQLCRIAVAAAAAVVCVFGIMLTAQAAGIDVFGAMARWTEDVFSFGQIPPDSVVTGNLDKDAEENKATVPKKFSSLQEALDAYGMAEVHEPLCFPEGYSVSDVGVMHFDDPRTESYFAVYECDDNYIQIDIIYCSNEPTMQIEKTDNPMETIEQNGITFYLIENVQSYTIAWCNKEYEYYVSGRLGKDILWGIASSMLQ